MVLIVFIWMQIRFYDDLVIIAHDSCYCFDISQIFCFLKQFCCKGMPLRYNNDKRKKPLFSRGSRVCRHLFNSFSKLKSDEKNIKKGGCFINDKIS